MGIKAKNISIIDQETIIDGKSSWKGKLVIKGTVKGTLSGDVITIAKEGAVYAAIKATSFTIGGIFEGNIEEADELIILSTGNCSGKIICKELIVEAGGILNAEVTCTKIHDSNKLAEKTPLSKGVAVLPFK